MSYVNSCVNVTDEACNINSVGDYVRYLLWKSSLKMISSINLCFHMY